MKKSDRDNISYPCPMVSTAFCWIDHSNGCACVAYFVVVSLSDIR